MTIDKKIAEIDSCKDEIDFMWLKHTARQLANQLKACREELDNERILFNSLSQCLKEAKQDTKENIWHRIQIFLKDECRPDKETISVVDLKKAFKEDDLDEQD